MRFFKRLKKHTRDEGGAAMILLVLMMTVLMGFAALAFDYAIVYYRQSQLQTAVDIAARAASRRLVDLEEDKSLTAEQKEESIKQVIKYYLEENGFPEDTLKVCKIGVDITEGISIDAQSAVELNFAKIFTEKPMPIAAGTTAVTDVTIIEGQKATVDVVFVLDLSTSMFKYDRTYTERIIPMAEAVNECIDAIMKENPENRIGIVTYGSENSTRVILPMTSEPENTSSTNVVEYTYTVKEGRKNVTKTGYKSYEYCTPNYLGYYAPKITSSGAAPDGLNLYTKDKPNGEFYIDGGTYIQYGITTGAKLLMDCPKDSNHRFPAVFVMTDGEATKGDATWDSEAVGPGSDYHSWDWYDPAADVVTNVSYYTVLTANYWKQKLTKEYTERNNEPTECKFYTLGFMLSDVDGDKEQVARGLLDPNYFDTTPGLNRYSLELKSRLQNGYESGVLEPILPDNYYYADKAYDAETGEELSEMLKAFANDVVEPSRIYNTRLTR